MPREKSKPREKFPGFHSPNFTLVPDDLFDVLLSVLKPPEIVVLLYIIRRTLGFKKQADNISLKQIESGITTRDGKVLDRGTGLNKTTIVRALKGLEDMNVIFKVRRQTSERGYQPTSYRLNIIERDPLLLSAPTLVANNDKPLVAENDIPMSPKATPHVAENDTQYTEKQNTEKQDTVSKQQQDDVVTILTGFGLDQPSTNLITTNFTKARILEKASHVRWLIGRNPDSVKNPAGFLRKAIEDDWPAPPGYTTTQAEESVPDCDICNGSNWIPVGDIQGHCDHQGTGSPLTDLPPESG
ncbi:MAG: replication protein [SAR202 cluster bacterium]|nr:replication protein [SAR202 cluster bacterium]